LKGFPMTNPVEPGHIPGQNPSTPERLPGHTNEAFRARYGGALFFAAVALAVIVAISFLLSTGSHAADSSTPTSDVMQTIAYLGGAIILGAAIAYGISRSRVSAPNSKQTDATKRIYREEEGDRQRQENAARKSSNPVDVIERKTDTTG
jgi:hypothetical protein